MKKISSFVILISLMFLNLNSQPISVSFIEDTTQRVIPKEIYGHFAEHLGRCIYDGDSIPAIHNTISKNNKGTYTLTFSNLDPKKTNELVIPIGDLGAKKVVDGKLLTADNCNDYNSFKETEKIRPVEYKDYDIKKGNLAIKLPPMAIVLIEMEQIYIA